MHRLHLAILPALLTAILLAACGGGGAGTATHTISIAQPADSTSGGGAASLEQSFVNVIAKVTPEVVQIQNPHGLGSGIVFDKQGDIVTNAHVVEPGGPYRVTTSSGHTYKATLVGTFAENDLAVVHASGASLTPATFANSHDLRVGDLVLAIGNPLGLSSSVTNGIISALGRTVSEPATSARPGGAVLPDVVQTSAAINPGNSGGALVDLQGQVVGIPTLAATDQQIGGAAPGIGFAIPSSVVTDIAGQIVKHGHVVDSHRAFLGVRLAAVTGNGAVVAQVEQGGPAAKAGIRAGELITSIDGHRVSGPDDVATVLATLKPDQTVAVVVESPQGGSKTTHVKLGQYPGTSS